ncbi:ROK family transcriptional regulator [Myceligenerans crystallogenes]|uniref:ROK family transcriptional regulator n=1 Tax=Myceligenerans crystallogenes TaxID=316335 RepID=A0ABN2NDE8_9MICO
MTTTTASRQHTLRERNLRLVAHAVFGAPEPLSRAGVAAATGLTRATVSTLADQLIGAGLIAELPAVADGRAGRPAVPLVPARRSVVGMGLEVNVDYLGARVVDLTGAVIADHVAPGAFHDSDPAEVLGALGGLARDVAAQVSDDGMRLAGARLALPGLVDAHAGMLDVAPNLGWSSVRPAPLLGLPDLRVDVANEAKLAALAEIGGIGDTAAGAADAETPPSGTPGRTDVPDSFLYVSGDVGIGAAIVVGRELFLGERGWNGEVGHVVVDPSGPRCSCGAFGCLEQFAGKEALSRAAGLPADAPLADLLSLLAAEAPQGATDSSPTTPSAPAHAALRRASSALGSALADFVNLVDVHTVVLGGIYTDLLPWLGTEIEAVLAERVLAAPFVDLQIRPARAGAQAALTGGAREVLRGVIADPAAWVQ